MQDLVNFQLDITYLGSTCTCICQLRIYRHVSFFNIVQKCSCVVWWNAEVSS